jgi:hypothetical protein
MRVRRARAPHVADVNDSSFVGGTYLPHPTLDLLIHTPAPDPQHHCRAIQHTDIHLSPKGMYASHSANPLTAITPPSGLVT